MRVLTHAPAIMAFSLLIAGCSPQTKPEQYLTIHRLHSSADPAAYVITQDINEGRAGLTKQIILATTLGFATNGNSVNLILNGAVGLQNPSDLEVETILTNRAVPEK